MKTGKSLGFKKGDFVNTGAFPGIIISDVHTQAPCCEVWGFEQEMGSAYAHEMTKLSYTEFLLQCHDNGYDRLKPESKVAKDAIEQAERLKQVIHDPV